MKTYAILLITLTLFSCKEKETSRDNTQNIKKPHDTIAIEKEQVVDIVEANPIVEKSKEGFLFIDISAIYYQGKELAILNGQQDTIVFFKGNKSHIGNNSYDIIEEEHLYEENITVESFDPEYGLFILACEGLNENGYYMVRVNDDLNYISKSNYSSVLEFKSSEKYVYDGFYYLDDTDFTLRVYPHKDSTEISSDHYKKYFYKPVEQKGDWLKLKDDKDCPLGELGASEDEIEGWLQWRKDGQIIVDFAYKCW